MTLCMHYTTCVEFLENFMFRAIGIQVGDVINVPDAIAEAADLKVPLDEGLDVLDFQSTICENRKSHIRLCPSISSIYPAPAEPCEPHLLR